MATTVSGRPTCSSAPDLVPNLVPRTQTQLVLRHSAEDSLRSAFAGGAEALVPFLGFIAVVLSHYKLIATTQPTPSPEDVCPPPRGTPAILSPTCAPSVSGRPRARKCGDVADVACFGRLHPILPTPLHSHPALRRRGLLLAKTRADYVPSLFRSPPSTASPFSTVSNSGTTPAEVRASSTSLVGRWWCERLDRALKRSASLWSLTFACNTSCPCYPACCSAADCGTKHSEEAASTGRAEVGHPDGATLGRPTLPTFTRPSHAGTLRRRTPRPRRPGGFESP